MKVYGYVRISTMKQSIERQIRNVKEQYPDAVVVADECTGTSLDRPGWAKLCRRLKPGDTVVFDSVSRMSRNAEEGFALYKELYENGVNLVFLKERHIDTAAYTDAMQSVISPEIDSGDSATDDLVNGIMAAVQKFMLAKVEQDIKKAFDQAEKEVMDLRQRTREGIETARLNGRQIGLQKGAKLTTKKSIASKEAILKHSKDFGGALNDQDCMKLVGVARNTFYKYKRELKADSPARAPEA